MEKILKASVTESYYGEGASGHRLVVDGWRCLPNREDTDDGGFRRMPSGDVLKEVTDSRFTVYVSVRH
jgi:hypothetical protein